MKSLDVCVFGLGYIGLPTATMLAKNKLRVHGVDVSETLIGRLNKGEVHFQEPQLAEIFKNAVDKGLFKAALTPVNADAYIICVPTPHTADHKADLTYIWQACDQLIQVLQPQQLVILESTSPPGTTEKLAAYIESKTGKIAGKDYHLAYCPERVLPGRIIYELEHNDRIVGGITPQCAAQAVIVYRQFVRADIFETTAATAEICKLTENAYRDVNIAFANEMDYICHNFGVDTREMIRLANRHPRVNILSPGPGVGGHCISVDPWFLVEALPEKAKLIHQARAVNDSRPAHVVKEVYRRVEMHQLQNTPIGILGLAYKGGVDDLRESPALKVVEILLKDSDLILHLCDPYARPEDPALKGFPVLKSLDETVNTCQFLVLLTDHPDFKTLGITSKDKILYDTRGVWSQ